MNFFETQRGSKFFDHQLPKLTRALEKIANTMSRPMPALQAALEPDRDFLQNLYYGSYEAEQYQELEHIKPLSREVIRAETALRQYLPPEGTRLFEDYYQAAVIRNDAVAEQAYEAGYRTAVQMILAGCNIPRIGGNRNEL